MFNILILHSSGIILGLLLRRRGKSISFQRSTTVTVSALILFFGLSIGANDTLLANLSTIGLPAVVITLLGITGSIVAALANVFRELSALLCCSTIAKRGRIPAAISLAGINSMDVCLPMIFGNRSNEKLMPMSILYGITLELSVPLLMGLLC